MSFYFIAAPHFRDNFPFTTLAMSEVTAQELEILSTKVIAAKGAAYCPYSKFRVGACILTTSGEYVVGANVENAAYPVGTCAERVAIGTAVVYLNPCIWRCAGTNVVVVQVAGHKEFKALAVATDVKPAGSPCGMCRQLYASLSLSLSSLCPLDRLLIHFSIREFTGPSFPVYMYDRDGGYKVMTMDEVCHSSPLASLLDRFSGITINLVAAGFVWP